MKPFFLFWSLLFLFNFQLSLTLHLKAEDKEEKKNYPEVHVHMEPSNFDLKALQEKSHDRRTQRNMIRDLEEKISLDKQAFQQVTGIQNDEIQHLSEAIKLNSYYTMRKVVNSKENKQKDQTKKDNGQMSFAKKIELLSDPFEVVQDENVNEVVKKIPKNRLETYGDIVDKIYGA